MSPAVLHAPQVMSGAGAAIEDRRVDVDCRWAPGQLVLCTVESNHSLVSRSTEPIIAALKLASFGVGARSVSAEAHPIEPLSTDPLVLERSLSSGASTALTVDSEVALARTDGRSISDSMWTDAHPLFGRDRDDFKFPPILYCYPSDQRQPTFRITRVPGELEAVKAWSTSPSSDEECSQSDEPRPMRSATLALVHAVPLVTNGGPVLSAGYVFREGWAGELGYDVALRGFALQPAVRIDSNGDIDVIPLVGFAELLKIGVPVRPATGHVAFRIQLDGHVALGRGKPAAPGFVLFYEDWRGERSTFGILASVGL